MNRPLDVRAITRDGPDRLDPTPIDTIAGQISAGLGDIRADIEEIRRILTQRQKSYLTVEEFAEQVGRKPYTVRDWIKDGRVAAIRVAGTGPKGRLLIPREEVEKLVRSALGGRVSATAAPSNDD